MTTSISCMCWMTFTTSSNSSVLRRSSTVHPLPATKIELPRVVDLSEVREQCGVFYKGDIYYDPSFTQSRSADRTLYIDQAETISESILECEEGGEKVHRITCPVEFYWTNSIFYNYNDQSTEQALSKLGELRAKIQSVFDRRALQLMSIEQVLGHFKQWREEYPEE